jgi:hypothetical protein
MIVQDVGTFTLKQLNLSTLLSTLPKRQTTQQLLSSRTRPPLGKAETGLSSPYPEPFVNKNTTTKFTVRYLALSCRVAISPIHIICQFCRGRPVDTEMQCHLSCGAIRLSLSQVSDAKACALHTHAAPS